MDHPCKNPHHVDSLDSDGAGDCVVLFQDVHDVIEFLYHSHCFWIGKPGKLSDPPYSYQEDICKHKEERE